MKNTILSQLQIIILLNNIILNPNEKKPIPKLIKKRKRGIIYSVNSWDNNFYCHTNERC